MAIDERVVDTSVRGDEDKEWTEEEKRAWEEKAAAAKQAALAALTAAAVGGDVFDPWDGFGEAVKDLVQNWRLPVPMMEVGVPVVGPAFVQTAHEDDTYLWWVGAGYLCVLTEPGGYPVRATLEEWGDLAAMTRSKSSHRQP